MPIDNASEHLVERLAREAEDKPARALGFRLLVCPDDQNLTAYEATEQHVLRWILAQPAPVVHALIAPLAAELLARALRAERSDG